RAAGGSAMKRRAILLATALAAVTSAVVVAQDAPESLLPPGFDNPAPAPGPAPRPSAAAPSVPRTTSPVIQPLPRIVADDDALVAPAAPRLDDLDPELVEQLLAAQRPKYDIPVGRNRSLDTIGVVDESEGGLPQADTGVLDGRYVQAVIAGTRGPLVSRWGSILLRRALTSRLATPVGMNGADWAALRAQLLLRMGEAWPARSLVQEVDSGSYTRALEDAALASYLGTADVLGICPIRAITAATRSEPEWQLAGSICDAFEGDGSKALADLERARRRGTAKNIDALLAQKFAGAALESRKAVRIEWTGVDELTPWRYGLTLATGLEPPTKLMEQSGDRYAPITARAPMVPLVTRAAAADVAAARGILSSAAMVDLYAQIYAADENDETWNGRASRLRDAYVAAAPTDRLAAMRELWGTDKSKPADYGRQVLTAYAAARMPPSDDFADASADLIASMLSAGLDRNAVRWAAVVPGGSQGWGLLAVAAPIWRSSVSSGALDAFREADPSPQARRSRFLVAGLAGLRRIEPSTAGSAAQDLGIDLNRKTRWSNAIDAAAASGNQALVVFLAGAGMQGAGWEAMTALNLFHIVSALRQVGLEGEARMIAAEAVARG
ncbi:MAG: hypothetical protein ABW203_00875, partial [Novosphingobium sp.]